MQCSSKSHGVSFQTHVTGNHKVIGQKLKSCKAVFIVQNNIYVYLFELTGYYIYSTFIYTVYICLIASVLVVAWMLMCIELCFILLHSSLYVCVYIYYLSYFWLKLLTGLGGQTFFTSGSVMTQVTGLSPQRSGVSVRPGHVEFVVEEVTVRQVFLWLFSYSPHNIIPPMHCTNSFITGTV